MRVVAALFLAALFLPVAPVAGQSSETDEKKTEKKTETESKTYTSYDLQRAGGARRTAPPSVPANPSTATATDSASRGDAEEEDAGAAEEAWRQELADAEAAVVRLEQQITGIELALGDLSRSVPFGTSRISLANELEQRREELVDAKARVEEIVQEGYGSGYAR